MLELAGAVVEAADVVDVVVLEGVLDAGALLAVDCDVAAAGLAPPELEELEPPHPARATAAASGSARSEIRIILVFVSGLVRSSGCNDPTGTAVPSPWQYPAVTDELRKSEIAGESLVARLNRLDPYWGAQLVLLAAILLDLTLDRKVSVIKPPWVLPALEGVAVIALAIASPHPRLRHNPLRRHLSLIVIAVVSAANSISLVLLCVALLHHHAENGRSLLGSGIILWATNVLLFGVWFWLLDRGGPVSRAQNDSAPPDFLFVQMSQPDHAPPNWKPRLVDYLYTSFTNATAFSPTDTMPLTPTAKWLMAGQSLTALVTVGLVVARAVNILQ